MGSKAESEVWGRWSFLSSLKCFETGSTLIFVLLLAWNKIMYMMRDEVKRLQLPKYQDISHQAPSIGCHLDRHINQEKADTCQWDTPPSTVWLWEQYFPWLQPDRWLEPSIGREKRMHELSGSSGNPLRGCSWCSWCCQTDPYPSEHGHLLWCPRSMEYEEHLHVKERKDILFLVWQEVGNNMHN